MFKLIPNDRGYFDLVEIQKKAVDDKHYFYTSDPESNTFTMKEKKHDEEKGIVMEILFIDSIMILYFYGTHSSDSLSRHFDGKITKVYDTIQKEFGFNIMEIIKLYPQEHRLEIGVFGYTIQEKNGKLLPVIVQNTYESNKNFGIQTTLASKNNSPFVPKFPNRFVKGNTHALTFEDIDDAALFHEAKYSYTAKDGSSTESWDNINNEYNKSYYSQAKWNQSLVLTCEIKNMTPLSNLTTITSRDLQERFALPIGLLQHTLNCCQKNTKALKEAKQMTEKEYDAYTKKMKQEEEMKNTPEA
jgi:hypothetical protein